MRNAKSTSSVAATIFKELRVKYGQRQSPIDSNIAVMCTIMIMKLLSSAFDNDVVTDAQQGGI